MPFKAYYLGPDGNIRLGLDEKESKAAFASAQGLLWVDISETTDEDGEFLARSFGFHHLAVEECVSPRINPPKINDFGQYLFIMVHGINYAVESDVVETTELEIFLGPHFVVSNHNIPLKSVETIRREVEEDGRPMKRGADFLVHALMDALIDEVLPAVDRLGDVAEQVEEEAVHSPGQATIEAILRLKRSTTRLHRIMTPQREVLNRLARGEFPLIRREAQIFYRNVYDHIVHIEDLNQSFKDAADSAMTTYMSSMATRQNETIKILSVVATIVLPLTLIAGIYGMNFDYMPELGWRWGYFAVLGFMGAVIAGATLWFLARRWMDWSRRRMSRAGSRSGEREKPPSYAGRPEKRSQG